MGYIGIKAKKWYKFQYVCEHCGEIIVRNSHIESTSGQNYQLQALEKSARLTYEGRKLHENAAKNRLLNEKCPSVENSWKKGVYPEDVCNQGKCPKCKEYQHWSKYFKEPPGGYGTAEKSFYTSDVVNGFVFICFIVALVIMIVINNNINPSNEDAWLLAYLKRPNVWIGSISISLAVFLIIGISYPLYAKTALPKWEKRKKIIKEKEHLNPEIVSWEEQVHFSSVKH